MTPRRAGTSASPLALATREALAFCVVEMQDQLIEWALLRARLEDLPDEPRAFRRFVHDHLVPMVEEEAGAAAAEEVERFLEPILRIATARPRASGVPSRSAAPLSSPPISAPPYSDPPYSDPPISDPSFSSPTISDQPEYGSIPPLLACAPSMPSPPSLPSFARLPPQAPAAAPGSDPWAAAMASVKSRSGLRVRRDRSQPPVLVADVDAVSRAAIAAYLDGEGYAVLEADGAKKALEICREHAVAVVFCDLGVPGMGGHYLASQLRRSRGDTAPPVYEISGDPEESRRATGLAGVLPKPLAPGDLLAVLESFSARTAAAG